MKEIGMEVRRYHFSGKYARNDGSYREARTTDRGFKVRTVIQYVRFYSLVSREHLVMYGGRYG